MAFKASLARNACLIQSRIAQAAEGTNDKNRCSDRSNVRYCHEEDSSRPIFLLPLASRLTSRFTIVALNTKRAMASLGADGFVKLRQRAIICQPFGTQLVSSSLFTPISLLLSHTWEERRLTYPTIVILKVSNGQIETGVR
jgi:hypothetical protein